MPDPKTTTPATPAPSNRRVRIEHRKRGTWVFEAYGPPGPNGKRPHDHENDLVIGDAAMTEEVMASHGAPYSRRVPPPVVTVPQSRIDAFSDADRRTFDALVARGDFQITQLAG